MAKKVLTTRKFIKPSFIDLIEKKRDAVEFNEDEIQFIVDSLMDKEMPDHQLASLLMAIYFQGLSAQETATLAEELMLSGEVIDLSKLSQPKIDKFSTGGVGDKSSLVLAPLAAVCGVVVPMMIGENEEYLISNLDKLSAIPGFKIDMDCDDFVDQLSSIGVGIVKQSDEVAPAEALIYKMRQESGTVPSIPLLSSSVLGKKLAQGVEGLVVDVKYNNGNSLNDIEQARQLARTITRVGRTIQRRCVALITDMSQPLGDCVGTALEIKEAVELLKGEGPEDLKELVLKLGMEIVRLAGVAGSTLSAKQTVEKHLKDGSAFEKFKEMVAAQGGKTDVLDDTSKLPKAKYVKKLPAPKRGYVHTINASMIAQGVQVLGASIPKGSKGKQDFAVGVSEIKKVGTQMKQGEALMMIHYNDETKLEAALEYFKGAYRLAPKRPNVPELIIERIA